MGLVLQANVGSFDGDDDDGDDDDGDDDDGDDDGDDDDGDDDDGDDDDGDDLVAGLLSSSQAPTPATAKNIIMTNTKTIILVELIVSEFRQIKKRQ